jgi:hypothetical protein
MQANAAETALESSNDTQSLSVPSAKILRSSNELRTTKSNVIPQKSVVCKKQQVWIRDRGTRKRILEPLSLVETITAGDFINHYYHCQMLEVWTSLLIGFQVYMYILHPFRSPSLLLFMQLSICNIVYLILRKS